MANFPTSLPSATPADHGEVVGELRAMAAQVLAMPLGVLGFAEVTTNQGSITTQTDLTGLATTVTVGTGRRVRITASLYMTSTVANDLMRLLILEGGTTLSLGDYVVNISANIRTVMSHVLQPSAGSHTYKLAMVRAAGTGTLANAAAAIYPSQIVVEDIGI